MKRFGVYMNCWYKNSHLVDVMGFDEAMSLVDIRFRDKSVVEKNLLIGKGFSVKNSNSGRHPGSGIKLLGEIPDEGFYALHEKTSINFFKLNNKKWYSYDVYGHFTNEELRNNCDIFLINPLKDIVASWLRKGIYSNFEMIVSDLCLNSESFLTAVAKTLHNRGAMYCINGHVTYPAYIVINIKKEWFLILLSSRGGSFQIKKRIEVEEEEWEKLNMRP